MSPMKIEVLYFQGCPNHPPTVQRVRETVNRLGVNAKVGPPADQRQPHLVSHTYRIDEMTCAASLEAQLQALPGVHRAEVSYERGQAKLVLDPEQVRERAVLQAVEDAGFRGRRLER